MIQKLKREVEQLKAEVRRLRQQPTPGILTQRTTRGAFRRPTAVTGTDNSKSTLIPRWG